MQTRCQRRSRRIQGPAAIHFYGTFAHCSVIDGLVPVTSMIDLPHVANVKEAEGRRHRNPVTGKELQPAWSGSAIPAVTCPARDMARQLSVFVPPGLCVMGGSISTSGRFKHHSHESHLTQR